MVVLQNILLKKLTLISFLNFQKSQLLLKYFLNKKSLFVVTHPSTFLLSPTLPPPYFLSPFFKTFVTHPPKISELDTVVTTPLSSDPDNPPKFGTCTNGGVFG